MIRQTLFDGEVEVGISEVGDGNMRFFGDDESKIIKNQRRLGELIDLNNIARIRTIYDERNQFTDYVEITKKNLPKYLVDNLEREILVSDGLATKEAEVGILLPLADCLGAVVFDERQKIVGLLHAGRQNVEQNGPKKFIQFFVDRFGSSPENLKVYFSPYAVNYKIFKIDKRLGGAAREQLIESGVLAENIIDPKIDTVNNGNFPSNSSGDTARRFAIVVKRI